MTFSKITLIDDPGPSDATPGLFNRVLSQLSANIDAVNVSVGSALLGVTSLSGTSGQIAPSSASTGVVTLSLPSQLSLPGVVSIASNFSVAGTATFQSNVSINGSMTLSALTVQSTSTFAGLGTFDSALTVRGDLRSNSSLTIGGNATISSGLTVGRESYASAFYLTPPLKPALSSVMDFGYADVGIGMFRSGNSSTIRWSGGTWREEGNGMDVSVLTARGNLASTKGMYSGLGGNVGRYQFSFDGSGMNQDSSGFNFGKNASPAVVRFGVESSGNSFYIGTARASATGPFASVATYYSTFSGDVGLSGTLNLMGNRLLSLRTVTSFDSTSMSVEELVIGINASGFSLGIRSGGTIYYLASSSSTKG